MGSIALDDIFFPERRIEGQRILRFVIERVEGKHNDILYVCGNCGCGKTSTVQALQNIPLAKHLPKCTRVPRFAYINCADLSGRDACCRLIDALGPSSRGKRKAALVSSKCQQITDQRQSITALLSSGAWIDRLPVVVLDEVEAAQIGGIKELSKFCLAALEWGTVAIIIVSNSKDLFNVNPKRQQTIVFRPYTTQELINIALREHQDNVDLSVVEFAAKRCMTDYNGDLRKMQALCDIAIKGANARQGNSKMRASITDLQQNIHDAPSSNVPTLQALPAQMLFVLCCCMRAHLNIMTVDSRPPPLSFTAIYASYVAAERMVGTPAMSKPQLREVLANLVDLSLLSSKGEPRDDSYGIAVHPGELENALKAAGNGVEASRIAFHGAHINPLF